MIQSSRVQCNQLDIEQEAGLIRVSRTGLLGMALVLVFVTGSLMLVLNHLDLDTWLFGPNLAIKVGGTKLTLEQFKLIKENAPLTARNLSNSAFAAEMVETMLLAEAGRALRLDKSDEFIRLRDALDQASISSTASLPVTIGSSTQEAKMSALSQSSPQPSIATKSEINDYFLLEGAADQRLSRTELLRCWFLIEELARLTRERVIGSVDEEESATKTSNAHQQEIAITKTPSASSDANHREASNLEPSPSKGNEGDFIKRLHLQEILVPDIETAQRVLTDASLGIPFSELNASYSRSLYAHVSGDLGWKSSHDFPSGVFEKLLELPVGSMTIGYKDEEGIHIIFVRARPPLLDQREEARRIALAREEARRHVLERFLQTMRSTTTVWVNPVLLKSNDSDLSKDASVIQNNESTKNLNDISNEMSSNTSNR